uniref:Uncharacterized protein n=1 Tax=Romanomermis culicivorax TaxID=13658 RepID=A0A915JLM8_ROMCU
MQGEGTPPLQAIAGVAEGIFGVTQWGQRSRCSCLSRFWAARRLLISGSDGNECRTLSGNGYSHCGSLSDHCGRSRNGIPGVREGCHGRQIERSANCMSSSRGRQHRDGGKRKYMFAYATATAG